MTIGVNNFVAKYYQRQLIYGGIEDFTPNATLPNLYGGQFGATPHIWKSAVIEFLSINIDCGLLSVVAYPNQPSVIDGAAIKEFLWYGDESRGLSVDLVWDVLFFSGTNKLRDILHSFGLRNWDAFSRSENKEFIASIKGIYASC